MNNYLLIIPIIFSFFVTLFILPFWMRKARQIGLVWDDMNKTGKQKVAGSGGIIAILGFLVGALLFIAYTRFYLKSADNLIEILALLLVIVILAVIGFIDDLLGWQHGGLSRTSRLILFIIASIPLMVINAGKHIVAFPFIGIIDLGILYPLILIPVGITGAAATYNFLAGFNGLEAGQGIILLSAVGFVAFFTGNSWLTIICLCLIAALIAFLLYNFCPAKTFPGDSLTLVIGGMIAIVAILGDFEKIAVFFFIPYIIETVLKSRGKLVKHSFGIPKEDGSIGLRYPEVYGLTHAGIYLLEKAGMKATEKKVVYLIWGFQIIVILAVLLIFREGIFLR
ncbi:MAG: glycosyl transferase family 4 [Nanoarchaeota archaeon]|nr:glycosyl transferase family 4 [Nanoarchaeota archaeon]